MLKNKKGYLLTETIIAITVVATVITIVYAIIMNTYIKQDNEVTKYNTSQGLQTANQIKKLCSVRETYFQEELEEKNKDYIDITDFDYYVSKNLDISKIYFSKNDLTNLIKNERIPVRIKRFLNIYNKETKDERCEYKYLVIFDDDSYSMIGTVCNE